MHATAPTAEFRDLWLPPVPSAADLPPRAEEGQLCFTQKEGSVFLFTDGRWNELARRR